MRELVKRYFDCFLSGIARYKVPSVQKGSNLEHQRDDCDERQGLTLLTLVSLRKPLFLYEHYILLDRLTLDLQLVSGEIWIWITNRYAAQNLQFLGDC